MAGSCQMKPAAKGCYPVNMLDPIRIQSRLAQKHWTEAGPMFLAYKLTSRLDLLGKKPDTVSQNQTGSELLLHSMIPAICGRMQPSLEVGNW